MELTTIGLDLAKEVFQVHGVDAQGRVRLVKRLRRAEVLRFFARLPVCVIGMEACAGAHFWARQLSEMGHTVKLMAPQFVKPYVKRNKNDARDAEAICEAVQRPSMRFVAVKSEAQQAVLALHTGREGLVKQRTALVNQIRGVLAEFGRVVPTGRRTLEARLPRLLAEAGLPQMLRAMLGILADQLAQLGRQIAALEAQLLAWHRQNAASRRLERIPGVGMLTATAAVAKVGNAAVYANARQFAASLGLVPRQASSGGKERLLGITKQGDAGLRRLLIHGARSVIRREHDPHSWLGRLLARRPKNVATVALAQKNARIIWALLRHAEDYRPRTALN